jgi:transposase
MANKRKQFSREFKENAVAYAVAHEELSDTECAKNLGVSTSALSNWKRQIKESPEPFRGSGNYSSEEAKEIARLKRELQNTQDALEILKKAISILGE